MSANKKFYISLVLSVVLSIFLIGFLIYPLSKEIKKNSEELLLGKRKIILLQKERENLQKLSETYKTYQSDLNKIEDLFVDSEFPVEFINFLEKNASDSQVQLKIPALIRKAEKEDPWSSLSLQLSVTGSFPNFLNFLEKLENSPYLIEILDLNTRKLKEIRTEEFPADTETTLSVKIFTQEK